MRTVDAAWIAALAEARGIEVVDAERAAAEANSVLEPFAELAATLRDDDDIYRFRRLLEEAAKV